MKTITLKVNELPALIELSNKEGTKKKLYKLNPAGKKFGASLNIIETEIAELLKKTI